MAEAMLQDFPEQFGTEGYDAVNEKMGVRDNPPDGLIFHSAGEGPNGFRIVDVWESQDHFNRFMEERLGPAIAEVTGMQPGEGRGPETTWWPVHNTIQP
jgi:hypothetical protein